ncbi:NAD(P)/FAD-dependent oxidoreductase [Thalassotalea castellviae]|uniref:FAD-dependent oxidoreductase n=1 Tax=Thalassotalea castellviae TaxID=3075612 RepID=A0ABU3A4I2_9GAMM|nr:FAD-dependent oxidoreductase [Thalassotalea sp. W431]MDT0603901.1 FAD-dependent oxidoreductase [Thalassotalea sp. W431]
MQQHLEALKDSKFCPLWHDQDVRPDVLPALNENISCELLIVGGGFTGLWAALQLKERQPEVDVVLIEKTFISDGSSGRNGGFLNSTLAHGESNTEHHFPGEADKLYQLGEQNLAELLATFKRYNIDARYEEVGETEVATNQGSVDALRKDYGEEKAAGDNVTWYNQDEIQAQVNSPTFLAGLCRRNGKNGIVDPARICWGLKRVLLELGVRIFENTPLDECNPLGNDKMQSLSLGFTITSDKVLMATNAYKNPISQVNRATIPVWDYQIATEPLNQKQLAAIGWHKSRHALGNHANMFHYYRFTQDNRITWGGGGAVRYYFNKNTDFASCADIPERFEQLSKEFFETFPQLKGLKFTHRWSGIIATSTRFCMVPGVTYNGRLAWAVGYTGLGVGASRFGARVGIELLGYQPSDILKMRFITKKPMPWAPEPFRWFGVKFTQNALVKADKNNGKRGLWLKMLDAMNLGFTC